MSEQALKKRIAELERALTPFAAEADCWADSVPNGYKPGVTEPRQSGFHARAEFNLGHLRRARKLVRTNAPST